MVEAREGCYFCQNATSESGVRRLRKVGWNLDHLDVEMHDAEVLELETSFGRQLPEMSYTDKNKKLGGLGG